MRDQGNSAYVRDTGKLHGGMLEWGFYEDKEPRLLMRKTLVIQIKP